jgi:hypothetical protein
MNQYKTIARLPLAELDEENRARALEHFTGAHDGDGYTYQIESNGHNWYVTRHLTTVELDYIIPGFAASRNKYTIEVYFDDWEQKVLSLPADTSPAMVNFAIEHWKKGNDEGYSRGVRVGREQKIREIREVFTF